MAGNDIRDILSISRQGSVERSSKKKRTEPAKRPTGTLFSSVFPMVMSIGELVLDVKFICR